MKRKNRILIISTIISIFTLTFTCLFADYKEDYEKGLREELSKIFDDPEEIEQFIEHAENFKPMIEKEEYPESISRASVPGNTIACDMIIITNEELKPDFLDFADIKNNEGICTQVVTTSQTGNTPEEIREYLKTRKESNTNLKYVLIGGDASVVMPKIIYTGYKTDYSSFPTDYYFCNVLSDWISEDEINFVADLYVGRIPADTHEEVQNFINKYIAYRYNGNYSEKYHLIANNLDRMPGNTFGNYIIDLIAMHIATNIDFTYEEDLDGSYSTPTIPAGVLLGNAFNANIHSFVFNVTHGGETGIEAININSNANYIGFFADYPNHQSIILDYELTQNDTIGHHYEYLPDYLTNMNPYILWNSSCSSTKLLSANNEPQDCFGACFLTDNNGAVAYYAVSHYEYPYTTRYAVEDFMDFIFNDEIHEIGEIMLNSHQFLYAYAQNTRTLRNFIMAHILFGDPSMQIWSGQNDEFEIYRLKSPDSLRYFLALDTKENPVINIRYNLISDGNKIFLRDFSDDKGVVEFYIGDEDISGMKLTAIKANFIPYSKVVEEIPYYGKGDETESSGSDILLFCYPNPMRSSTTFSFSTTKDTKSTKINIYNVKGQLVRHFGDLTGKEKVVWSGQDNRGRQLSNGIYFYRLETDKYKSVIRKILMLR